MVKCSYCGVELSEANMRPSDIHRYRRCMDCARKAQTEYRHRTLEMHREKVAKWRRNHKEECLEINRRSQRKRRFEVLSHYSVGEPRCARCGFTDLRALCIDHINGDGAQHRRETPNASKDIYSWLKKNNYPEGFQVLCMNCNWIKRSENGEL